MNGKIPLLNVFKSFFWGKNEGLDHKEVWGKERTLEEYSVKVYVRNIFFAEWDIYIPLNPFASCVFFYMTRL